MPQVDYQRQDFADSLPKWELVDDCDEGPDRIRAQGEKYLPKPNATDTGKENEARYKAYLTRAVFFNATARTLSGLIGQVFSTEPEWDAPEAIKRYETDIDGGGVSLIQQSKEVLRDTLKKGRAVLFTDFASVQGDTPKASLDAGYIRPTIVVYDAKQVINWRVERVGAKAMLTMVNIFEVREIFGEDPFKPTFLDTWRVLTLEEGRFIVRIWRKREESDPHGKEFVSIEEYAPLKGNGTPWDEITITFIGSVNNDPMVDPSPLHDLATINIGHYRNSADYEESSFICGQPTLALTTELGKEQFDAANPNGVALGSRGGIFLGPTGSAALIQSAPNTQPFEAMGHKERQMVALGAKLVEQREVQRTLGEAAMENASETSILGSVANNVSDAYEAHLYWMAEYLNLTLPEDAIRFRLNTDFDVAALTAELMRELTSVWTMGGISDTEYRARMKKGKIAFEEDEDWQESREQNPPGLAGMTAQPAAAAAQKGANV